MPLDASDERRHVPSDNPRWQESVFFLWYDPENEVGGVARIGLQPNLSKANMWAYVSKGGRTLLCKSDLQLPLPATDWDDMRVGPIRRRTVQPLQGFIIDIQDDAVHASLEFRGFHEPFDYEFGQYTPGGHAAAGHFEGSGDVRGTLEYEGERLAFNGMGHHDHSWGPRDWSKNRGWIWIAGASADHQLSFNATNAVYKGRIQMFGYVFDGRSCVALPENTLAIKLSEDGKTHCGVSGTLIAADGRKFEIAGEVATVGALAHENVVSNEGLARFTVGDQVAYGVIEHGVSA